MLGKIWVNIHVKCFNKHLAHGKCNISVGDDDAHDDCNRISVCQFAWVVLRAEHSTWGYWAGRSEQF